jgi:hypothetical protein
MHAASECFWNTRLGRRHGRLHHRAALLAIDGRELAGAAERRQAVDPGREEMADETIHGRPSHPAPIVDGRDEIGEHAMEVGHRQPISKRVSSSG